METIIIEVNAEDLRVFYYAIEREIRFLEAKNEVYKAQSTQDRIDYLTKLKDQLNEKEEQLGGFSPKN